MLAVFAAPWAKPLAEPLRCAACARRHRVAPVDESAREHPAFDQVDVGLKLGNISVDILELKVARAAGEREQEREQQERGEQSDPCVIH